MTTFVSAASRALAGLPELLTFGIRKKLDALSDPSVVVCIGNKKEIMKPAISLSNATFITGGPYALSFKDPGNFLDALESLKTMLDIQSLMFSR